MRVLATAGRKLGRRTDAECGYTGLIYALRAAGVLVEEGLVVEGQDLSGYDLVLCEVPDPAKVWGDRFRGAMWALHAPEWRTIPVYSHFVPQLAENLLAYPLPGDWMDDAILNLITHKERAAVPAFPWGTKEGFEWAWTFDPSMFMTQKLMYSSTMKVDRRWVLATYESRQKWLKDQELTWPVEQYGSVGGVAPLEDIIDRYLACWGALIFPWKHLLGTGYWRIRYVHMAQCRSIFWMDSMDAYYMDDLFDHGIWGEALDEMSDAELLTLADAQSSWFFDHVWSAEKMMEETMRFVAQV